MILPSAKSSPIYFTNYAAQVALDEIVRQARTQKRSIDDFAFRVGLSAGGCSGFSYFVKVDDTFAKDDMRFYQNELAIVIDKRSHLYLQGTQVDYVASLMEKKFVFDSPTSKGSCGCGLSVSF